MSARGPGDLPLWDWAVAYYDRPGVAPVLLALQDRCDVDVPLALWRIWRVATGRSATPEAEAEAVRLSADWRGCVVAPLRAARDALKSAPARIDPARVAELRERVLAVELCAERLQFEALEALAGPPAAPGEASEGIEKIGALPDLATATEGELSTLIAALDDL